MYPGKGLAVTSVGWFCLVPAFDVVIKQELMFDIRGNITVIILFTLRDAEIITSSELRRNYATNEISAAAH